MTIFESIQALWHQTPSPVRTFLIAATGVLFGAWIASRSQTKKAIVAELHALRFAYALCFSIANKALAIKRQHIRPIREAFEASVKSFEQLKANHGGVLHLQLDLRTLSQTTFPTGILERIIFDKCFLGGQGIATAVALSAATDDLKISLDMRNGLIEQFRNNPPDTEDGKAALYLGLPIAGEKDERIKDNIYALYHQTDDCIFFSRRLADAVLIAENKLRKQNFWKYRLPGRKLKPARWAIAEKAGLIPPDAQYSDWLRGFVKEQTRFQLFTHSLRSFFRKGPSEP